MAPSIMTAKTFEPSALCFGQVERNSRGGKFIPIVDKHGKKARVTVQFPTLHLPFGISGYREKPEDEPASYSVDLSFRGIEDNENIQILLDKLNALDKHLLDAAEKHSHAWFGRPKTNDVLKATYRYLTKQDNLKKYPPILKTKIAMLNGKPNVQIFDVDRTPITIEDVPRGSYVKVISEIASIWQVSSMWGVTFRAVQILVMEKPSKLSTFAFVDDGHDTLGDSGKESGSDDANGDDANGDDANGDDANGDDMYDKFI